MANLKEVIYLNNSDYETLSTTGTVTINGVTLTYDADTVYITPDILASTTENGLMSSTDKSKLDGIASGAQVNVIEAVKVNGSALTITNKAVDITSIPNSIVLGLGTAATKDTGTSSGNVPVLNSSGKLDDSIIPAVAITDTNYYATSDFNSSNGTKIATGYSSGAASTTYDLYAPNATASQAGLITTGAQTFAGTKTFASGEIKIQDPNYPSTTVTLAAYSNEGADTLTADCIFKAPWIVAENYLHTNNLTFGKAVSGDSDYGLVLPSVNEMAQWPADRTIAAREDITNMQSTSVVVKDAITNINDRVFQNYTATLVTSGGYTFYQILKNGNNPTEDEAKEYMRYMTGSTFLPKYNYDFPKQTIFTFADRSTWKPQYSSSDGLRLYRLTTPLALESDIPDDSNLVHKGTSSIPSNEDIYGSKHFLGATTIFSGQYGIRIGIETGYTAQTIKGYQLPNSPAVTGLSIETEALVLTKLPNSGAPDPIISDGKSGYGLNIPDTASWTANKTIATTDDITQILRFI